MPRRLTDVGSARRFYRDTLAAGAKPGMAFHERSFMIAFLAQGREVARLPLLDA